jgi:hypothetical protein
MKPPLGFYINGQPEPKALPVRKILIIKKYRQVKLYSAAAGLITGTKRTIIAFTISN